MTASTANVESADTTATATTAAAAAAAAAAKEEEEEEKEKKEEAEAEATATSGFRYSRGATATEWEDCFGAENEYGVGPGARVATAAARTGTSCLGSTGIG